MEITIEEVLKLEGFKNARVIAGKNGLKNNVNKAMLMEVPDILPFVQENNLLITTLYPIFDNKDTMERLIENLSNLKLSGICIKKDRYINDIPTIMIDQANKLDFPIIELNSKENLSDLVSEIINLSLDKHIEILEFKNFIHTHLMNLFLKGEEIKSLINGFSKLINYPVILLDNNIDIICTSKDINIKKINIKKDDLIYSEFDISIDNKIYNFNQYIKHSINAGKNKFGYLIVLNGDRRDQNIIMAMEEASLLIASAFYKNYAVLEKEKNFQDSFIRDILQGVNYSQIEAITKAKSYGWDLEFPQVILVLKVFNKDENFLKKAYEKILNSNYIERVLSKKLNMKEKRVKITYIDESLVIFANVAFISNVKEEMIELSNLIKINFEESYHLGIGISSQILYLNSFPTAYKEAQDSLLIGHKLNNESFVSHYDDYQLFSIIKEVKNTKLLNKYVNNKLGKILDYDKENNMELMKTVITLMDSGLNYKEAAKKLFIHYNTLRYRLDRLKELGIDINNGSLIAEMIIAYHIYIWLEINNR